MTGDPAPQKMDMDSWCKMGFKILAVIFIGTILAFQIEYLANEKGSTVYHMLREDHFDMTIEFKSEDGFNVAISLIDPSQPALIDPRYVQLLVYYLIWETNEISGLRTAYT